MKKIFFLITLLVCADSFSQDDPLLMENIELGGVLNDMPINPVDGEMYYNDTTKLTYKYNASRKIWFINRDGSSINLFNAKTITCGAFIFSNNETGVYYLDENITYNTSDYIKVIPGQDYVASHNMRSTCFFDEDKNLVLGGSFSNSTQTTIPNGAVYIRFSYSSALDDVFQFQLGTESTSYESYKKSYQEQISELNKIKLDKESSELTLFTPKAREVIAERLKNGYSLGVGFADDVARIKRDVAAFKENPSEWRPFFGENDSVPSQGVQMHTSAVYAWALKNETIANIVANELLEIITATNLYDAYWVSAESPVNKRFASDDDLWIQVGKVKKMFDSYGLIKEMQTTLGDGDKLEIENWFKRFKEICENNEKALVDAYFGKGWEYSTRKQINNNVLYSYNSNQSTPTPIYTNHGDVMHQYTMIRSQDEYNNRRWEVINYIHGWAIHNDDTYSEFWTRQFFKEALKYGLFPDGTWCEMFRNHDNSTALGVSYGFASLAAMLEMAHNDALANHFPYDRLYDYTTTEGVVTGSINLTNTPYVGSSTTDGVTEKSIYTFLIGQSKYLRNAANGGWNNKRSFKKSTGAKVPLNATDLYQPSIHAALANLYYKNTELEAFYKYDTSAGYPVKKDIYSGYNPPFATQDAGAWTNLINGMLWYEQEDNFFDYNTYSPRSKENKVDNKEVLNLYNKASTTNGVYFSPSNGNEIVDGVHNASDFISVKQGSVYSMNPWPRFVAFYGADKNLIPKGYSHTTGKIAIPVNVAYVRLGIVIGNDNQFMMVEGDKIPSYFIPYKLTQEERIKQLEETIIQLTNN